MVAQLKSQFYTGSGERISLGGEIARGGEGCILNIREHPDLVAKIYHRQVDQAKADKLSVMVSLKTERLLNLTAWPVDTLHDFAGGPVSGFLMQRITDHKNIHILYGVKSRNAEYPEARWPFLIQAAGNVARAFNVIHEHGHVIGDVNHGSMVVSKRATVRLVDCDSFQITTPERQFLCGVGISTHLPPELQGEDLQGIVRTIDHDSFGLAIIIFQLLFMGRHPFSGTSLGLTDISLEKAIREHRFAYGPGAESRQMRQPPATLGLDAVSPEIALMFEQAFLTDTDRPKPAQWITALTQISEDLQKCTRDTAHFFINSIQACPWCEIESHSGIILFKNGLFETANEFFDLVKTWVEILSVKPPSLDNLLSTQATLKARPTPESLKITSIRRWKSLLILLSLVSGGAILLFVQLGFFASFALLTVILISVINLVSKVTLAARDELSTLRNAAGLRLIEAEKRWKDNGGEAFLDAVQELEAKKKQYESLTNLRHQKIEALQKIVWERRFQEFLSGHKLQEADLPGVGVNHISALRSYGIETAEDVTEDSIKDIPGLKAKQTNALIDWRKSLNRQFKNQPKPAAEPVDLASVEAEILNTRNKLQRDLQIGPAYLRQLSRRGQSIAEAGRPEIVGYLAASIQAQEDVKNCRSVTWVTLALAIYLVNIVLFNVMPISPSIGRAPKPPILLPAPRLPEPALKPDFPEDKPAQALFDRGLKLHEVGNTSAAIALYKRALAIDPSLKGGSRELGDAYMKVKNYSGARDAYRTATINNPKDAAAFSGLGLALKALGKLGDSSVAFERAAQLNHSVSNYFNLAQVYKALKNNDAALNAYREATHGQRFDLTSHYRVGLAYIALDDLQGATAEFIYLNSIDPPMAKQLYQKMRQVHWVLSKEVLKSPLEPK